MFFGRPFGKSFGANVCENGGVKKIQKWSQKESCKENDEKGPGTCFPLKEENLRLPSSAEACRFDIGSSTLCVPLRHSGEYERGALGGPRGFFVFACAVHYFLFFCIVPPLSLALFFCFTSCWVKGPTLNNDAHFIQRNTNTFSL